MAESDKLREWAESTGPYEHMVWVGKDVSIADVKRWVRADAVHLQSSDIDPAVSDPCLD